MTFSFQAPAFYAKHGFEVVAAVDDHPHGHKNMLLRKRLGAASHPHRGPDRWPSEVTHGAPVSVDGANTGRQRCFIGCARGALALAPRWR